MTLDAIAAVLFEPVGCLAEFQADEFDAAARRLFGAADDVARSGSQAYWRLLGLIDRAAPDIAAPELARLKELELAAVERSELYEDVAPSLEKLRASGVSAYLVSSLSRAAVARFVERFSLAEAFMAVTAREDDHRVKAAPLRRAIEEFALDPRRIIYLVDTAEALEMTSPLGLNALLLINDYDEGRALAQCGPAGGVVSLAELADALQLIAQRAGLRSTERMPAKPFELFEPP